jgi:prophage antirepressor-like protein
MGAAMAATATVLQFEKYRLHAFQRHGSKLPWFVLAEVCAVLGLTNPAMVAARLDDDEKGLSNTDTLGGSQQTLVVSLSGLTRLAGTSRKPIAKRFNKWLHSDVVVAIFLTGEFKGDSTPLQELVGSFQPLLDLPEPQKPAEIIPLRKPTQAELNAEANRRHLDVISDMGHAMPYGADDEKG